MFTFGLRHVDLQAQHVRAVRELARAHAAEEVEVLRDAAVAVRARRRPGSVSVPRVARISSADWLSTYASPCSMNHSANAVEVVVVVRRVVAMLAPVVAQPAHRLRDRVLVLDVLLERVGVVEAQVAAAAVLARRARS